MFVRSITSRCIPSCLMMSSPNVRSVHYFPLYCFLSHDVLPQCSFGPLLPVVFLSASRCHPPIFACVCVICCICNPARFSTFVLVTRPVQLIRYILPRHHILNAPFLCWHRFEIMHVSVNYTCQIRRQYLS